MRRGAESGCRGLPIKATDDAVVSAWISRLPLTVTAEGGCRGLPIEAADDADVAAGCDEAEAPLLESSKLWP